MLDNDEFNSTIISMEESGNQEQIFENLKLHKEVLGGVKQQPWPLRRKIRLVRQAKAYVRRHEGALQERLAQSRSTKDVIARISLFMTKVISVARAIHLINMQFKRNTARVQSIPKKRRHVVLENLFRFIWTIYL